ncbi:MAG: hypothetical protein QNK30_08230 [Bacteroidales bacterium]|nr:hypothetical protein [Bacteroidales bacterium]
MYKLKSEIIEQIQYYHRQVCELYQNLYRKSDKPDVKNMLADLSRQEKSREEYLEKHKVREKAMNRWLQVPPNKISNQMSECFNKINANSDLSVKDVTDLELHFDNCLIKLYKILSSEEENNGYVTNIFYYMLKKTKGEDSRLQKKIADIQI